MPNLTHAHRELFRRAADERFASLAELIQHCRTQKAASVDRWQPPQHLSVQPKDGELVLVAGSDGAFHFNEWSFGQLCGQAHVSRDTVNRLLPETAARVFAETMPTGRKPLQLYTSGDRLRSIHGVAYERLHSLDLLNVVREFDDFQPPQEARGGGTGLYAGEQDCFAFLIDPTGWADIGGQAFAPGFFVWNSEVGKRSIGISTFWFQAVCANHIVWDATEVVEITRKHTASVHEALGDVRRTIDQLVAKRDARRDGFVRVMQNAMQQVLGDDAEDVAKLLARHGVKGQLAKRALEVAREQGRFTIFALVDALTRLSGELVFAGDRLAADQQAAALLALAA